MKVAIVGDRECTNYEIVKEAVKQANFEITEVVSGGARGVDKLAERWAKENCIPLKVFKANWDDLKQPGAVVKARKNPWTKRMEKYNANAGFYRNKQIVDYVDAVIAIQPNGPTSGTNNTIKLTKEAKKPLHEYEKRDEDYDYKF